MPQRTLHQVAQEARRYRREHGRRAHLPVALRKAVAELSCGRASAAVARELGVSPHAVSHWRKLYPAPRVEKQSAAPRRSKAKAALKRIDFVEIKAQEPRPVSAATEVSQSALEVTRPDGSMVRVTGELAKDALTALFGATKAERRAP
jgi:hypothetical protein